MAREKTGRSPATATAADGGADGVIDRIARRLRVSLRRALDEAVKPPRTMSRVRDELNLDKTLASRINRAAGASDPMAALAMGPGAPGYRLLIERLRQRVPAGKTIDALAGAVDAMEEAYGLFPDGRRGFEAALAGWVPENRDRGERRARQQIYQATLFLMGVGVDIAYQAYVYVPSKSDPRSCDMGYLEVRQGLRRARNGGPTILTGVPFVLPRPDGQMPPQRIETLSGELPTTDARIALLPEFCTKPLPELTTFGRAGALLLVAAGDTPAVGERLNTAIGVIGRQAEQRYRSGNEVEYGYNTQVLRKAVRVMIIDVLIADELELGDPQITTSGASGGPVPARPSDDQLDVLPQSLRFESLGEVKGSDTGVLASEDAEGVPRMIERMLGAIKPRPRKLRAFRVRIEYPMPHTRHVVWVELPAEPQR